MLLLSLFLCSCSSKESKALKQNLKGEYIFREHTEFFFTPPPPTPQPKEKYPWEDKYIGNLPRITKEFFRCKGDPSNPFVLYQPEGKEGIKYYDCQGKHGLPLREGKEFVYPTLIEILNFIQQKTNKRVIITCGHRCPKHNLYVDHTPYNWSSKHMLGAEVDFYVQGMEQEPLQIIDLIKEYYSNQPAEYQTFQRFEQGKLNVSTPPWMNKEIFIKLYLPHEGRNCENTHPYPYLGIQIRHDRDLNTKVTFDQKQSQNYLRN